MRQQQHERYPAQAVHRTRGKIDSARNDHHARADRSDSDKGDTPRAPEQRIRAHKVRAAGIARIDCSEDQYFEHKHTEDD